MLAMWNNRLWVSAHTTSLIRWVVVSGYVRSVDITEHHKTVTCVSWTGHEHQAIIKYTFIPDTGNNRRKLV